MSNYLRSLTLSDNPGLVGNQDPHGLVQQPDVHLDEWNAFCRMLSKVHLIALHAAHIGMGPRALAIFAQRALVADAPLVFL